MGRREQAGGGGDVFGAIVLDVWANRRGRSVEDVADELQERLAAAGVWWSREAIAGLAQSIVAAEHPLRHPVRLIRRMWASASGEDDDRFSGEPDPEDLLDRLRGAFSVRSVRYSPGAEDVVEVVLIPWSDRAAQEIRDVCAPLEVRFVESRPEWRDWDNRWP